MPARGGIGEDIQEPGEYDLLKNGRTNRIKHRVLYVPDQVSKEMYQSMIKEPEIHEVLSLIKSASMVLHGIGDAITMAERRKMSGRNAKTYRIKCSWRGFWILLQ